MRPQNLTIIQSPTEPCDGLRLVALTPSGNLVTIWSGSPPSIPPGIHPCIAQALERGSGEIGLCWIEERGGQHVLQDLPLPMPLDNAIAICVQLADALAALHSRGLTHGRTELSSVAISPSGTPMWIGTGRQDSSTVDDISGLKTIGSQLNPDVPLQSEAMSAASLAALWREHLNPHQNIRPWLAQHRPVMADTHTPLRLELMPLGLVDEVQPDLGQEPHGHGILDRWKTDDDEFTDDPTVSVDAGALHTQTRQHILNSLFQTLDEAVESKNQTNVPPSFRNQIQREALDPIPTLNGIDHGTLHNPGDQIERTAGKSHPDITHPSTTDSEETTGLTGAIPTQQSIVTGLLVATVLGMLGAAIMLALVWIIIGDVF